MLIAGEDAQLSRGWLIGALDHGTGFDALRLAKPGQEVAVGVGADAPRKDCRGPKRGDIGGHVGGTTKDRFLRGFEQNRDGGFGRNAADLARNVLVQDHVADDEDVGTLHLHEMFSHLAGLGILSCHQNPL